MSEFTFYEFFAGGGMVRAGLGAHWRCLFANDINPKKASAYRENWGAAEFHLGDVHDLDPAETPSRADLAWASFPCQDLSLAGPGAGLDGSRSGAFWGFWRAMKALSDEGRAPRILALENVRGALTSNKGQDFVRLCKALADLDYRVGAMMIDAALFLPQSRPRLFVIAAGPEMSATIAAGSGPVSPWHPEALIAAHGLLPRGLKARWLWWTPPVPPASTQALADLIEEEPDGTPWRSEEATRRLLSLMTPTNLRKVAEAQRAGRRMIGTIYKRMRKDQAGIKTQRAEVRFDDLAGCLRTPAGGSSRQTLMIVEGERIRTRLLTAREAARLMGLPDSYRLPRNYTEAYHLAGDGVAVPVVRHLARHVLEPLLRSQPLAAAAE